MKESPQEIVRRTRGRGTYDIQNILTDSNAGTGNDTLYAGAGDDVAMGERGDDTIYLESGNDKAWGGEGADVILGGAGDDIINGDNGFNIVAETLHGNDFLDGGDALISVRWRWRMHAAQHWRDAANDVAAIWRAAA